MCVSAVAKKLGMAAVAFVAFVLFWVVQQPAAGFPNQLTRAHACLAAAAAGLE